MARPRIGSKRRRLRSMSSEFARPATGGAARNVTGAAPRQVARLLAQTCTRHWPGPAPPWHRMEAPVAGARGFAEPNQARAGTDGRAATPWRRADQLDPTIAQTRHAVSSLVAGQGAPRTRARRRVRVRRQAVQLADAGRIRDHRHPLVGT